MRSVNHCYRSRRQCFFPIVNQTTEIESLSRQYHHDGDSTLTNARNAVKRIRNKFTTYPALYVDILNFFVQKPCRYGLMKGIVYVSGSLKTHNGFGSCHRIRSNCLKMLLQFFKSPIDDFLRQHSRKTIVLVRVKVHIRTIGQSRHRNRVNQN